MKTTSRSQEFKRVMHLLLDAGEHDLALRFAVMEVKISCHRYKKTRLIRKQKELMYKQQQLHNDLAVLAFTLEMEDL